MSEVSDYKSSPFDLYTQPALTSNYTGTATPPGPGYTGTGLNSIPDYSYDALCGVKFATTDGRILAIVRNAATAIGSGKLVQGPAEITAFEKLAMTVPTATPATAGTYQVLVTNGATVLKQNLYAGGYLITASSTGLGQTLQIASHQAAANAATFLVTLIDPIQVTLSATTTVSLVANPYIAVVITDHTTLGNPVGATSYAVSASTAPTWDGTSGLQTAAGTPVYAFVVTHGVTGILVDSSVTNVGYPIGRSPNTDGAVGVASLTTAAQIGISVQTLTSAQYGPIDLKL